MKTTHRAKIGLENSQRKFEMLSKWAEEGIPRLRNENGDILNDEKDYPLLVKYPKSLNQYKRFKFRADNIKQTSDDAFKRYLLESEKDASDIELLLKKLDKMKEKQLAKLLKTKPKSQDEAILKLENLIEEQNNELAKQMLENKVLAEELEAIERRYKALSAHHEEVLKSHRTKINRLNERLKAVSSLKVLGNDS